MLETIALVASEETPTRKNLSVGPRDATLRRARTCYDHFAGALGVALTDALLTEGRIELTRESGALTDSGVTFLAEIGMNVAPLLERRAKSSGRVLCRACLDWSERRYHLGGVVGTAICGHCMKMGWTKQRPGTRAVLVTRRGEAMFRERFNARLT